MDFDDIEAVPSGLGTSSLFENDGVDVDMGADDLIIAIILEFETP